jgi:hypothetical protein
MADKEFLRLLIPVRGMSRAQRARAVALGNRIEGKVARMLADGADADRLMAKIESYFGG